jgi:hypothetical protein
MVLHNYGFALIVNFSTSSETSSIVTGPCLFSSIATWCRDRANIASREIASAAAPSACKPRKNRQPTNSRLGFDRIALGNNKERQNLNG